MSRIIAGRFDRTVDTDAALPHASAGSRFAGAGAIAGALLGGLAGMLVAWLVAREYGALVVLLGAALGAYVGSFLGAMNKVRGGRPQEATREYGARDLGRAEGVWRNGWKDFDPRAPLMTPLKFRGRGHA